MTMKPIFLAFPTRSKPFILLQLASFSNASSSLTFRRRLASTVSVTIACIRLQFLSCSDSKSTSNTSSWVYTFSIMSVRNVAILLTLAGGASRPSWRRFHSCTRRPQRRFWSLFLVGSPCARSSHSSTYHSGDSSHLGGIPKLFCLTPPNFPYYIKEHCLAGSLA